MFEFILLRLRKIYANVATRLRFPLGFSRKETHLMERKRKKKKLLRNHVQIAFE